jgi:hypothetical protein
MDNGWGTVNGGRSLNRFGGPRHNMAGEELDESIIDVSLGGPTASTDQPGNASSHLNVQEGHPNPLGVSLPGTNTEWAGQ